MTQHHPLAHPSSENPINKSSEIATTIAANALHLIEFRSIKWVRKIRATKLIAQKPKSKKSEEDKTPPVITKNRAILVMLNQLKTILKKSNKTPKTEQLAAHKCADLHILSSKSNKPTSQFINPNPFAIACFVPLDTRGADNKTI
jgi:hypothetical protein